MSTSKQHKLYGVWIGGSDIGYEKGKAYYINITTYYNSSLISLIGKNKEYKEYETLIQFLWDWEYVKRDKRT